jgi:hypothetical protein
MYYYRSIIIFFKGPSGDHLPKIKKKLAGKNLNPKNRNVCYSASIALLQSVAKIGTPKNLAAHIRTMLSKRRSRSTPEKWHADIIVITQ